MSFGWSANDIVALARLSYQIYSFCQGAPEDLRGLFDKFQTTGQNLNRLASVLEASGLGQWQVNDELRTDLESCRDDLSKFAYIVDGKPSPFTKVKGIGQLYISQDKLKRIEKRIERCNQFINEAKMDLIVACSLRNLQLMNSSAAASVAGSPPTSFGQLGLGIQQPGGSIAAITGAPVPALLLPPPFMQDTSSNDTARNAISSAEQVLASARRRRRRESSITANVSFRDDQPNGGLYEIAALAEEIELYAENANVMQNPEQLDKIVAWARNFERRYSNGGSSSMASEQRTSQLMGEESAMGVIYNEAMEHNTRNRNSIQSEAARTTVSSSRGSRMTGLSDEPEAEPWPQPWVPGNNIQQSLRSSNGSFRDLPVINEPQAPQVHLSEENIELRGQAKASLTANNKDAEDCSFCLSISEGSVILTVTCQSRVTGKGFGIDHGQRCFSFRHCITTNARPIPNLLHPSVEGPPKNPYTITFTDAQFVSLTNSAEDLGWLTSLKYIFFDEQDRELICSHIFGKTLLMSFGCTEIRYEGKLISQMPAVILWRDSDPSLHSITFPPYLVGGIRKDTELRVVGLWDAEKAKAKKTAKILDLAVEKITGTDTTNSPDLSAGPDRRNSSVSSTGSLFRRRFSAISTEERPPTRRKCTLTFSDLNDRNAFIARFTS